MSKKPVIRPELPNGLYWKGNKIYYVISHHGQVSKGSTHTAVVSEAVADRDHRKARLVLFDKADSTTRVVKIPELLDDYLAHLQRKDDNKGPYKTKTSKKTGYTVNKHVRTFFKNTRADKLGTKQLNDYVDHRKAEYRAEGRADGSWVVSINRELSYLRAAMKLGFNASPKKVFSVPRFPIDAKAEKAKRRKGFVSNSQYDLLMEHLSDHMKPVLPFVLYSAVRSKELKFIRRRPEDGQLDWEKMVIHLRAGETIKAGE